MTLAAAPLPIKEFSSISEGLAYVKSQCSEPFIVTSMEGEDEFKNATTENILAVLESSNEDVMGYIHPTGSIVTPAAEAVKQFREKSLKSNICNSHVQALAEAFLKPGGRLAYDCASPLLTKADEYTALHYDPPQFGGGWMYLSKGEKFWVLVHPKETPLLVMNEEGYLKDLPLDELAKFVSSPDSVRYGTLRAGQFLFFPPSWSHQVTTPSECVGLAGYCPL